MGHLPADINLKVGDVVGLLLQSSGALHFFLNGVDMVKLPCTVPEGVYGVVDLYGQCVKVSLRPLIPQSIENPRYVMYEKSAHELEKELLASELSCRVNTHWYMYRMWLLTRYRRKNDTKYHNV